MSSSLKRRANWDTHANVAGRLPDQCRDVDQACYGLVQDLKSRGLLDETLVIWGGEFGRTVYSQGGLSKENYGRNHHPRCFTMWMAGGGVKSGTIYGATDDFSYNIAQNPVHVRDFHATVLQLLGFDHRRFTFKFQGLDQRLTGVIPARVVNEILACAARGWARRKELWDEQDEWDGQAPWGAVRRPAAHVGRSGSTRAWRR